MIILINIFEALRNLLSAKLRAFLAILGILVGTGSVVALISSSQLATNHALAQFKTLGTNLLSFYLQDPYVPGHGSASIADQFTLSNVPDIFRASDQVRLVAPYISLYEPIVFDGKPYNGQILGITQSFFDLAKLKIQRGRPIYDFDQGSYFCVIGASLAHAFRQQGIDPLMKQILLGKNYFTVVGILRHWQPNLFIYADLNNSIVIPLPMAYRVSKEAKIDSILVRLKQSPRLELAQSKIQDRLQQLFPNKKIQPRNPKQIIDVVSKQRRTFSWLLTAIGGISLLVGGIGVMNIMLVSVVERRREIGIRMAVGAKQGDILMMFLVESVILTVFGGVIGIVLGVLVSFGLAEVSGWIFQIFLLPIVLGFLVSLLVGVISGFYPALRASQLDPIETLVAE